MKVKIKKDNFNRIITVLNKSVNVCFKWTVLSSLKCYPSFRECILNTLESWYLFSQVSPFIHFYVQQEQTETFSTLKWVFFFIEFYIRYKLTVRQNTRDANSKKVLKSISVREDEKLYLIRGGQNHFSQNHYRQWNLHSHVRLYLAVWLCSGTSLLFHIRTCKT